MLACVRVRNFAIIDELEIEFGPGLNVFTGETGAGKSILVSALQLVLGGKGRSDVVRAGAESAEVEASFDLRADGKRQDAGELRARLDAAGIEVDDELVIRRVIRANGRTRAYVNGRMTTAGQLAQIASGLADISSQHEYHTLVDARTHLGYLDAFAGHDPLLAKMATAHAKYADAQRAVDDLLDKHRDRDQREDLFRFQVAEIDALEPVPGEYDELVVERDRLRHASKLAGAAGEAESVLYADDAAICERLARVVQSLSGAAELDATLTPLVGQLESAAATLDDVAGELGRYSRGMVFDPARLAFVEERLDRLSRLKRKYGGTLEAVLAHRDEAAATLASLDDFEGYLERAEADRDQARDAAMSVAKKLRRSRQKAASKLGAAITSELASLEMRDASFEVCVEPRQGGKAQDDREGADPDDAKAVERLSVAGIDQVEFRIAPNCGEEARSLARVASGGELSRSMLAIKRVLAGLGPAGLYVFDEVDTGVGGAVAEVIGQKLFEVASHSQVLCITHLPQIAVYADGHYKVRKEVVDNRTHSRVERLDNPERREEVARMLGGVRITKATRAAAKEMMQGARAAR